MTVQFCVSARQSSPNFLPCDPWKYNHRMKEIIQSNYHPSLGIVTLNVCKSWKYILKQIHHHILPQHPQCQLHFQAGFAITSATSSPWQELWLSGDPFVAGINQNKTRIQRREWQHQWWDILDTVEQFFADLETKGRREERERRENISFSFSIPTCLLVRFPFSIPN